MSDDRKHDMERLWLAQRLVKETGVTEAEAHELMNLLGADWPSLVREARLLVKKR